MSNLCTGLIIQNTTERNNIISQVKDMMVLQPKIFLTGIRRLLLINTLRACFTTPNRKSSFSFVIRQTYVPKYVVHSRRANFLFAEEFWSRVCPDNYFPLAYILRQTSTCFVTHA